VNQKLISEIGKSQRLQIVNRLKRTQGLTVSELSDALNMSYMGVKQHCIDLQKDGYLDTWRRPKPVGRPEMLYRLTQRAHELFPQASNAATIDLLESAKQLYGPSAPEKLLFNIFQKKAALYAAKLKGDTLPARVKWLARLRDHEGFMADFVDNGTMRIVENHSPILDLLRAFPIVARLECELFQRVLHAQVTREESCASGLYRCTFQIN
jgi:predicted ArsR family transcriptional regulator